ncbi:MAG: 2-oxoacid:acceptor oxidoreductase subunit alpha [Methanobacteriaceae archaeon]
MDSELFIQGNEACAIGAIKAGCRFFAGYPITPSTEVAEDIAVMLPKLGGSFIQMEDEIAALGAVIGASWSGLKAMTSTSGPGFSLMQEHIGYAQMTETPMVIINVQRGSPSTAQPTMASQSDMMQARWGSHGDYEPIALCPSSVQECFDFTVKAFELSEKYRIPVILLSDEIVGHMREKIIVPDNIKTYKRQMPKESPESGEFLPFKADSTGTPPMPAFGDGYKLHVTGLTHNEQGYPDTSSPDAHSKLVNRLCDKILKNRKDICSVEKTNCDDADIIVVSFGAPSRSVATAIKNARAEGIKAGCIKLNIVWPLPEEEINAIAEIADNLLVVEMNLGQVFYDIQRVAGGKANTYLLPKIGGEIHKPNEILAKIKDIGGI